MFSAYNTDVTFCKLLIKHGAKINKVDNKGYTALEYVLDHSSKGTTERDINQIITILLNNSAKIKPITLKAALKDGHGESENRYSVVKRILEGLIKSGQKSGLNPALEAAI
jgi:ankyrin repeat protein